MAIVTDYIKLVDAQKITPEEAYLKIQKELDGYVDSGHEQDERVNELRLASGVFAHWLANIYLKEHGLIS